MTDEQQRWCPTGHHWLRESAFDLLPRGRLARDCKGCSAARARREAQLERERRLAGVPFTGIDMDRVYVARGLMTPEQLQAARGAQR